MFEGQQLLHQVLFTCRAMSVSAVVLSWVDRCWQAGAAMPANSGT